MAVLDPTPYPIGAMTPGVHHRQWPCTLEFERLTQISDSLPDGQVVGAVLSWPRADGYAHYLVTADEPLTLQHIPYIDAWSVEPALIKGLDRDDVLNMLDREKRLRALHNR